MLLLLSELFIVFFLTPFLDYNPYLDQITKYEIFYNAHSFIYEYVLGMQISEEKTNDSISYQKLGKNVMVLLNHPGFLDFFSCMYFHQKHFGSSHTIIFATIPLLTKIPFLGKHFEQNPHFTLYNGMSEEDLLKVVTYLENFPSPFVLYLMPEGGTHKKSAFEKSQNTEIGKSLQHLTVPRSKAVKTFFPLMDSVLDLTLMTKGPKGSYLDQCVIGKYPSHLHIQVQDVSQNFKEEKDITKVLESIWLEKDQLLEKSAYHTSEPCDDHLQISNEIPSLFSGFYQLLVFYLLIFHEKNHKFLLLLSSGFWTFFVEYFFWNRHYSTNLGFTCLFFGYLLYI